MAETPQLPEIYALLIDQIADVRLRVYAIQSLLQEGVPFSASDVAARIEVFRTTWTAASQRATLARMKQELEEAMRLLLDSYTGPKQ